MERNFEKFAFTGKRGRPPKNLDPYQTEDTVKEPAICQKCNAVYQGKHWQFDGEKAESLQHSSQVMWVTCPACTKIEDHYPEGFMTLKGDYLWAHEEEIRNLLRNEAEAVMNTNPLSRIMQIKADNGALVIETTEQKLAEHLGRSLTAAHSGELNVQWSKAPKVCRVEWERWNEAK